MNREIMELLDKGVTIVTPTRRLVQTLKDSYTQLKIENGAVSWPSADILDWSNWCRRAWDDLLPNISHRPLVLNQTQEQALWLQVIRDSRIAARLLHMAGTARQARESYRLCKSWRIPIFPDDVYLNEDAYQFRQWVMAYEQQLSEHSWIDMAGLPDRIITGIEETDTQINGNIAFYGFDEWLPQQMALFNTLKANTGNIIEIVNKPNNKQCAMRVATDGNDELEQAARWARICLEQDPGSRIGIIVPRLDRVRHQVDLIFRRQLCVESLLTPKDSVRPYVISQGLPLLEYPLVTSAMNILALLQRDIFIDQFCMLLKSSFIRGFQQEQSQRAILEANIRKTGEQRSRLQQLLRLMDNLFTDHRCSVISECLHSLASFLDRLPGRLMPGEWAVKFSEQLKILGWPGDRTLSSDEYQTMEAWNKALDDMMTLDLVSPPMDSSTALGKLARILTDTGYQPETGEVPVQITGTEATAAMGFDHLWITGLHDQAWPPNVLTVPFVPITLQRQAGMPAASASDQLKYSRELLNSLVESSLDVVLSYATADKDRVLRPSPLLNQIGPIESRSVSDLQPGFYERLAGSGEFEVFEDRRGPGINPDAPITGGSSLFKDQALCPFRAFSRHRLHAKAIEITDIGLDARDRGLLVHRALQLIWNKLKGLDQLRNTSESVLEKYISNAVDKAIQQQAQHRSETFTDKFRQLEQKRLVKLVTNWLLIDLGRPTFTVVATEKGHHVNFAGITLGMRLDRVDELPDGRLVIIDYKTGDVNINHWEGDRPSDPQLPLYAVTCDGEVAALAYASLKTGDMKYIGLAQEEDLLPGCSVPLDTDWNDKLAVWRDTLNKLGSDFINGNATVDPKDYSRSDTACRYCDLHALCRIHEKAHTISNGDMDE